MIDSSQAQTRNSCTVRLLGADDALDESHFEFLVSHFLPQELFHRLAAFRSDLGRCAHLVQTVQSCTNDVVWIG